MLITYIVALLVVAIILYASYRSLATNPDLSAEQVQALLQQLTAATADVAVELRAALSISDSSYDVPTDGKDAAQHLKEQAAQLRKRLAGIDHRMETSITTHDDEHTARAVSLRQAVQDLQWACRMVEAGMYAGNEGVRTAVASLCDHGERCVEEAARRGI